VKTLILDNYDSYTQILANLIWKITGSAPVVIKNDAVTVNELKKFQIDHIVISPGPGRPEKSQDFGICSDLFKLFPNTPILGVCLGHQGMGVFTGASITYSPKVHHGSQSPVYHTGHSLFKDVPSPFSAMRYHSLVIDRESVNDDIEILATSGDDGQIMAIQVQGKPFYGVQFHPESVGTEHGTTILKNFLNISHDWKLSHNIPVKINPTHKIGLQPLHWKPPEEVFDCLYRDKSNVFWLDSCEENDWSFMGIGSQNIIQYEHRMQIVGKDLTDKPPRDIFDTLKEILSNYRVEPHHNICPFQGGLVGYFSYEATETPGTLIPGNDQPLSQFLLVEEFIAFHHPQKKNVSLQTS